MENNKRKILLVDDDQSLLDTLGDFLKFEGYEVICSFSGEDALIKMRPFQPDLIILDMGMPGMGGKGFLDRITNPDGSTAYPVLVLTARSAMAEYFSNKKISSFLAKPCDPADLLMEVGRILFIEAAGRDKSGPVNPLRRLVVAEPDQELKALLQSELTASGFQVESVSNGAEALEKAITIKPDAVVMRLDLDQMSANEVVAMLKRLPSGAELNFVIYGVDMPNVDLDHVANLSIPQNCIVRDLNVNSIVDRVMNVTGA
ncbi:MAG: response regulator [Kiritimatiellae bacterium]|jgi:DNA-binding response OmpR family regulator|nr:response regulator [Kiritimatiellia bacterium]